MSLCSVRAQICVGVGAPTQFLSGELVKRPRVLLADDHKALLDQLRRFLESEFEVVGTVGDGQALVIAAETFKPDVMVVDISMPVMTGIEAVRQILEKNPNAKVVFFSVHEDPAFVTAALGTGALGYVIKRRVAWDLVVAIQQALRGRSYISPLVRQ